MGLLDDKGAPAVFLDKDGTLVKDIPYNVDPERIELFADVPSALGELARLAFKLVVVTNQPGVAEGRFSEPELERALSVLDSIFREAGVVVNGFYYCPHSERTEPPCGCRKPLPGLLRQAADELGIDLDRSWLVGDILNDIAAGKAAGCRTVLVNNGGETEWELTPQRSPDFTVGSMSEAVAVIKAELEGRMSKRCTP